MPRTIRQCVRWAAVALAPALLGSCGGSGMQQVLVSSQGDFSEYLGNWSYCVPRTDGYSHNGNITFTLDAEGLVLQPGGGIIGSFEDANCTRPVPGRVVAVTPAAPRHIKTIATVSITSSTQFTGSADALQDMGLFVGFSADFKFLWVSPAIAFEASLPRYEKN